MRRALLLGVLLVASALAAPVVRAGQPPCERHDEIDARPAVRLTLDRRDCEATSRDVGITDPDGRTAVSWYDDERGVGLEVQRAPRFVAWTADEEGCHLIVYVIGALDVGCVAGAPPSPRDAQVPR